MKRLCTILCPLQSFAFYRFFSVELCRLELHERNYLCAHRWTSSDCHSLRHLTFKGLSTESESLQPSLSQLQRPPTRSSSCPCLQTHAEQTLPVVFALHASSPRINGFSVVFSPKELAAVIHLVSLVGQKYEAVSVHADLDVFGALGEIKSVSVCLWKHSFQFINPLHPSLF